MGARSICLRLLKYFPVALEWGGFYLGWGLMCMFFFDPPLDDAYLFIVPDVQVIAIISDSFCFVIEAELAKVVFWA